MKTPNPDNNSDETGFLMLVQNPLKFNLFLLKELPAAFFSGLKVSYADDAQAIVTLPYRWFTRNPFRSTYFACLSMAAEMSTGILAMNYTYKRKPAVNLIITKIEASFIKKATGITKFTCEDGLLLKQAVEEAAASGKSITVSVRSTGRDKLDEIIAEFQISWSFKIKSQKQ